MKAKIKYFTPTLRGCTVCFECDKSALEEFEKLKNDEVTLKVSKFRRKRSLNANSYMWVLLEKLAVKTNLTAKELYMQYIYDYGISRTVEIANEAVNTLTSAWSHHGTAWLSEVVEAGEKYSLVKLYYGTSSYNTKQMSRIINAVVEDCRSVGIETLTEAELEELKARWDNVK